MNDSKLDQLLLENLYHDHYKSIYKLVSYALFRYCGTKADAADLTQQVFIVAAERIDVLHNHVNPAGWLMKTAQNQCLNYIRRKIRHNEQLCESLDLYSAQSDDFAVSDLRMSLEQMLRKDEYDLVQAYCMNDQPVEEICEQMETVPNTIRVRIHRIRKFLAKFLILCVIFSTHQNI